MHSSGRFVRDLDGILEDSLWDDVIGRNGGGLGAHVYAEVDVAAGAVFLDLVLQRHQPLGHQVDILCCDNSSYDNNSSHTFLGGLNESSEPDFSLLNVKTRTHPVACVLKRS